MSEGRETRSSLELQRDIARPKLTSTESDNRKYQLTVRLPRDIFQLIEFEAERSGVSLAEVVRRYIREAIEERDW